MDYKTANKAYSKLSKKLGSKDSTPGALLKAHEAKESKSYEKAENKKTKLAVAGLV